MNEGVGKSERPDPSSFRLHPSSFSKWRNAILGTLLVVAGLAAALITVLARHTNNYALAAVAAVLSLVSAVLMLIFIVPPLARSARLEVRRFDFPIEITTGGGIFLTILVVVGFAAWNTGNNLLFMVFSLLFSTLFVGGVAARASLRDLIVSARFPDHIFAGDAAPVIVTLRNAKRLLPSFSILVEARGPEDSGKGSKSRRRRPRYAKRILAYFTYVPHRAAAEQRVEQLFTQRGHVLINGFELSTRFPFGFFRFRRRLGARNVDIVVYPKPVPIGDKLHLLPTYAGRIASLKRGMGHDLFSLRDYQPQDDLRHIDWKATARSRSLTVREYTAEDERRITIVLDIRDHSEAEESFVKRFENGVVQAASLLKHFIDEHAEVRLKLGNDLGRYGGGLTHLYASLRRLALVKPENENGDVELSTSADDEASMKDDNAFDGDYAIVLTTAPPGTIPARIWRVSHVIHL